MALPFLAPIPPLSPAASLPTVLQPTVLQPVCLSNSLTLQLSFPPVEINEEQSNEKKQRLLIQSSLLQGGGVSHHHLHFDGDPKAGRRVGRISRAEKGRLRVCPVGMGKL